jgi:uncharacterized protein YndB with AHSA1/START domain
MAQHIVSASALIHAPAQQVYAMIADYRERHPQMLPKPYFVSLAVEQGDVGAGTVITFHMRVMGRLRTFHAIITEPEPGRVLVETDLDTGATTTFTVDPRAHGQQAYVTIATATTTRPGVLGKIEGWFTTRLLHPIYVKELAQLAALVTP